jgi:hypothetical protein
MADEQVGFRPGRHRRQPFQEFQRLEHQLPRAVVPRPLQLKRDAAVAPPPQALLRERRAAGPRHFLPAHRECLHGVTFLFSSGSVLKLT